MGVWRLEAVASAKKQLVTIKGVKEGLIFQLNDDCAFDDLLGDLKDKLGNTHDRFLDGPEVSVQIRLGKRWLTDDQLDRLRKMIEKKKNLRIQSVESDVVPREMLFDETGRLKLVRGIVRAGQTLFHDGDLLLVGDVNPGGTIAATGDIYVIGSLRGVAHAGVNGREEAIIVASHMKPTQLRIAGVISRPPEEGGLEETFMEFAYLNSGIMQIDKIANIGRIRPGGQHA
jgi:septum site-determining protein MinC